MSLPECKPHFFYFFCGGGEGSLITQKKYSGPSSNSTVEKWVFQDLPRFFLSGQKKPRLRVHPNADPSQRLTMWPRWFRGKWCVSKYRSLESFYGGKKTLPEIEHIPWKWMVGIRDSFLLGVSFTIPTSALKRAHWNMHISCFCHFCLKCGVKSKKTCLHTIFSVKIALFLGHPK